MGSLRTLAPSPRPTTGGAATSGRALAEREDLFVVNFDNIHRRREELLAEADVAIFHSVVDLDLFLDDCAACVNDDIKDTVDYAAVEADGYSRAGHERGRHRNTG